MDLIFSLFKNELIEIKNHLKFIENLNLDITSTSLNFEYSNSSSRKKYDYNSIIVSLYGIVESYIEKFIESYLIVIEKNVFYYNSLNKIIIESHFKQSIFLINKISEGKYQKYNKLKKEVVLNNLNNCLEEKRLYTFNKEAFVINTGNLKHKKICDIFKSLNINLDQEIRKQKGFDLKSENLFNKLDDLVDRRNEIAHGAISEIMDNSEIIPLIDFLENYFAAINSLLQKESTNEINCFKRDNFSLFIEKIKIYDGNILGVFEGAKFDLNKDSEILIEKSNNEVVSSNVIDFKQYANNDNISIKLDKKIKENYKFYIFNKASHQEKYENIIV